MSEPTCEVCGGPLGYGRLIGEGVCQGCEAHGSQWAHRQLIRLWNSGLDRVAIAEQLGYDPETVSTLVFRLRHRGAPLETRKQAA